MARRHLFAQLLISLFDPPTAISTCVDVLDRDAAGWVPATIVERTAADEWTVEFDDGERAWRDHQELRPHSPEPG